MANDNSTSPRARDYGVGLSPLTGSTVRITGTKVDGTRYEGRELSNVSWIPTLDGTHRLTGWDTRANAVRTFKLTTVETVTIGGIVLNAGDLVATMTAGMRKKEEAA